MRALSQDQLAARIKPGDRVLDVGGWHAPLNRADVMIDFMPYETRNRSGAIATRTWPNEHFSHSSYFQMDICGPDPWPFKDKEFDFAVCSHTLEDVRDPIFVCRELNRVARGGYIEVPSRLVESTRGVERPFFCGYYHHRWLCEVLGGVLEQSIQFQFKPAMLHAYRKFYLSKPWYARVNPDLAVSYFFWQESFGYSEKIIIDRDEVQRDLQCFRRKAKAMPDKWISKYSWLPHTRWFKRRVGLAQLSA